MNTPVAPNSLASIKLNLPTQRGAYYGGKWHEPKNGRYLDRSIPAPASRSARSPTPAPTTSTPRSTAAKAAYKEWRRVPPLERAKMLKKIAEVLRDNAGELAMIDAADCGNPIAEMIIDATIAAAQIEFFAGLVTEMKGASIPMGPDRLNFSVREPLGVVGRIVPFNHPFMFIAGKAAAPLAAGNTIVMKPPEQAPLSSLRLAELIDGLLPPGVFNLVPGGKEAGAALASHPRRRQDRADRQRADRQGGDARRRRHAQGRAARTRRQERADRLSRRRSRRGRGRRGRRHELHLVRPVLRLHQPRLHPREDLRRRARAREGQDQALQAGHPDRSGHHHGRDHLQDAVRPRDELHRVRPRAKARAWSTAAAGRPIRRSPRASTSSRPCSPT